MTESRTRRTLPSAAGPYNGFRGGADGQARMHDEFDARLHVATPVKGVLGVLEARGCHPRRNGVAWRAHCPAHEDTHPSLSISEGRQGRVLLRCWSGCETREVLAALGLRWSDLFPPQVAGGRGHVSP
jgi:hypothetical protein